MVEYPTAMGKHHTAAKLTARGRRIRRLGRKLLLWTAVVTAVLALIAADQGGLFGQRQGPDMPRYHGKTFRVTRVMDGDTFDVEIPDGRWGCTRIRLWGVDTPETVKPDWPVEHFGPEASQFTRRAIHRGDVRLELLPHRTRDKYGRLLGYAYLPDGRMLNRVLIENGLGFADPRFNHPYKTEFARLQAAARRNKRGLWENPNPDHIPYYLKKAAEQLSE
ncbi:MAG TPA: hypothetical protein ENH84_06585 [Phycisphaerae bacterium]|nr:hypothetical protein [Phycisphaerae bacterium]